VLLTLSHRASDPRRRLMAVLPPDRRGTASSAGARVHKQPTRANRGPVGRLAPHASLGAGGRAGVTRPQSLVTTSSSSVLTGPWYVSFAEIRYQTPKINGMSTASGT